MRHSASTRGLQAADLARAARRCPRPVPSGVSPGPGQSHEPPDLGPQRDDVLGEGGAPLEAQRDVGDPPAVVLGARPGCATGTRTSSRNSSQKWLSPSMVRIGRTSTPGWCMSRISQVMPLCLGAVGVGAHQQLAVVGHVRPGAPDLLAVHHVVVAVALGPGAQRGQIGSGLGLGEALAPDVVAAQDAGQVERAAARRCPRR